MSESKFRRIITNSLRRDDFWEGFDKYKKQQQSLRKLKGNYKSYNASKTQMFRKGVFRKYGSGSELTAKLLGKKAPGGWGRFINPKNINTAIPYIKKTMGYAKKLAGPGKVVGMATATGALVKEAFGIKKVY